MELLLIHTGKAYLPELRAYRRAFSDHFDVHEVTTAELDGRSHPGRILYFFMGFFPGKYEAHAVVHDYRSLSVGAFPAIKDLLKRRLHSRPDLRVFANEVIAGEMAFRDAAPAFMLDMGVHLDLVRDARRDAGSPGYDLCYVGDVSHERRADAMLREFLRRADGRTLALAGKVDHGISTEFRGCPEIEFLGRLPLRDAYDLMSRSETGICYLPNRRPYRFQTPVKLLEYAALGLKVIVNDTASNVNTLRRHGIEGLVMNGFEFPGREEVAGLADNRGFDSEPLGWESVIRESGIVSRLCQPRGQANDIPG